MCDKMRFIYFVFIFLRFARAQNLVSSENAPQTFSAFDEASLHKFDEKISRIDAANENFRLRWDMLQIRLESQSEQIRWLNQKVDLLLKANPKTACFSAIDEPVIDVRAEGGTTNSMDQTMLKTCTTAPQTLPQNCFEATNTNRKSGIYKIQTHSKSEHSNVFYVPCDAETQDGGWAIVLRRKDGSIDFFRHMADYEKGFGNLEGEFFIGLEKLHEMTDDSLQELLIIMEDFDNVVRYAKYDTFAIGSPKEFYALTILGNYSGDAGDSLTTHGGAPFTAKDADHDEDKKNNCAILYNGGWWYKKCHASNLMGQYLKGAYNEKEYAKGVVWKEFRGYNYSLKHVQMMIRPKYKEKVSNNNK